MRAFIVACVVAVAIAGGTAAIFDILIQETASAAFAELGVRN
jgi:hypothetical protein